MAILGKVIKSGLKIRQIVSPKNRNLIKLQKRTFLKLIFKARNTEFGQEYNFNKLLEDALLSSESTFYQDFKKNIPLFDYDSIYQKYWQRCRNGEKDITWPGRVRHFALSSGTSEASSKYIPVTKDMIKAIITSDI